ncbi:50S ribosomal protein L11 methyltransferase [Prevotella dentasini]|uniref:50S ribosomal protein L11 methyltransferase n=1 Tax=Prevotella dentasini TaxID=589537 RepID=UPI000468E3F6|nr:50S ribosomal protein L11 methyltransferase [Prevotella dentasini]
MKYIELEFNIKPDSELAREIVMALAGEAGVESFYDEENCLKGYIQQIGYSAEKLTASLNQLPLEGVDVSFFARAAEDKDWNTEWEKSGFEPICIEGLCVISHIKDKDKVLKKSELSLLPQKIWIEPRQAFGSGTHETTQMIVSTLLNMDIKGKRVLDCGCGTGILGIIAAQAGAKNVVGYDIDEWSVDNTRHNAVLNGVEIEVLEGDKSVLSNISGLFDIVLANINRNILLDDMEAFVSVMNECSWLILSGFYKEDVDLIAAKAKSLGLILQQLKENRNWCCLSFVRAGEQV